MEYFKLLIRLFFIYLPVMPVIATLGWVMAWLFEDISGANGFVKAMHQFFLYADF